MYTTSTNKQCYVFLIYDDTYYRIVDNIHNIYK